jgi:hypothetical protein
MEEDNKLYSTAWDIISYQSDTQKHLAKHDTVIIFFKNGMTQIKFIYLNTQHIYMHNGECTW